MKFIGIDIGSTCAKTVVMNENKEIVLEFVQPTGWSSVDTAEEIRKKLVENDADPAENVCVATGYGRVSVPYADKMITEITCHAMGAVWIFDNKDMTIIDIGGQDAKAIRLDNNGMVSQFFMNDKCAAGTGRFLEMMARTMEMSLDDMGKAGLSYKEDITISSMCTVFAESEVVSLIAQNKATDDIVHGLNKAVASKTAALAKRVGGEERYMMTGGVSKNQGLVKTLEEKLGTTLVISDKAQLCGALGAALFAKDMVIE